ncbi:hypothetical protein L6452_35121 [Arctium lappa]|uniref:Uncharacterized protein n=1 Tax=Arctium lappa TaxID=4217 RepID=A0ACB8YLA9_ARCLA|nr:hypothetical protein L6452_35121 [Arctium lappa]
MNASEPCPFPSAKTPPHSTHRITTCYHRPNLSCQSTIQNTTLLLLSVIDHELPASAAAVAGSWGHTGSSSVIAKKRLSKKKGSLTGEKEVVAATDLVNSNFANKIDRSTGFGGSEKSMEVEVENNLPKVIITSQSEINANSISTMEVNGMNLVEKAPVNLSIGNSNVTKGTIKVGEREWGSAKKTFTFGNGSVVGNEKEAGDVNSGNSKVTEVEMTENGQLSSGKGNEAAKQSVNAWKSNGITLADKIKGKTDSKIVLKYKPPIKLDDEFGFPTGKAWFCINSLLDWEVIRIAMENDCGQSAVGSVVKRPVADLLLDQDQSIIGGIRRFIGFLLRNMAIVQYWSVL